MNNNLTRPIIGIENRTAQEVFDIMCSRITGEAAALRTALEDMLDDMGEYGLCVCQAAKTQALNTLAALASVPS